MNQNQLIYKDQRQSKLQKQPSYRNRENVDNFVLKGNAGNPYKQHVDNQNLVKIKEYKEKMHSHYQNVQAQRQAELDNKRNKILLDMNKRAEQQKA